MGPRAQPRAYRLHQPGKQAHRSANSATSCEAAPAVPLQPRGLSVSASAPAPTTDIASADLPRPDRVRTLPVAHPCFIAVGKDRDGATARCLPSLEGRPSPSRPCLSAAPIGGRGRPAHGASAVDLRAADSANSRKSASPAAPGVPSTIQAPALAGRSAGRPERQNVQPSGRDTFLDCSSPPLGQATSRRSSAAASTLPKEPLRGSRSALDGFCVCDSSLA